MDCDSDGARTATGAEAYCVDCMPVSAKGVRLTSDELDSSLAGRAGNILWDDAGRTELSGLLSGLATTSFEADGIRRVLDRTITPENWRVGEALAEAFLVDHRNCTFPWPAGRDLKTPTASPAGTDLVGFRVVDGSSEAYRFAFGEVKTSDQEQWPPSVMFGRHGMVGQIEALRDSTETKDDLVRYLGHHAKSALWQGHYVSATKRYLNDPQDVSLFGILVRDVGDKPDDLSGRAKSLAQGCPPSTSIELRAIYLPSKCICSLATRATGLRGSRNGNN